MDKDAGTLYIRKTSIAELEMADRRYWLARSPRERVEEVERLRLEAGKFLYEYPARLRRVVATVRGPQR